MLAGTWRLQYTTAADVLVLLELEKSTFGFLSLGDIYQAFDAWGNIENVIRASVPLLLQPPAPLGSGAAAPAGATLRVAARYAVAGAKTLRLWFDTAALGDVNINATLEALIAPALLPRTPPQMMLLQWLKDARLEVPLRLGLGGGGPDPSVDGGGCVSCALCSVALCRVLTPAQAGRGGGHVHADVLRRRHAGRTREPGRLHLYARAKRGRAARLKSAPRGIWVRL